MKVKKTHFPILIIYLGALLVGCSQEMPEQEMPSVNEDNCRPDNIARINNKRMRAEFQEQCVRGAQFKPSPVKKW